jgi:uncharacterized protein
MLESQFAADQPPAAHKERALEDWLRAHAPVLLGFSGGVDSAYLAVVALSVLGAERFLAVIGRSESYPAEQWADARALADQFRIPVLEVATNELRDERYSANPSNRCYFCKTELWHHLVPIARDRGFRTVIDGTNADDLLGHRPGALAATEAGVESPLALLGFTKAEIRERSHARGIAGWSKPSSPCLSSRIPYGIAVTAERLGRIERAERALRALGITGDLRVRHHGDLARVELSRDELPRWLAPDRWRDVRDAVVSAGYGRVCIDLAGFRSGSLNVLHSASTDREAVVR